MPELFLLCAIAVSLHERRHAVFPKLYCHHSGCLSGCIHLIWISTELKQACHDVLFVQSNRFVQGSAEALQNCPHRENSVELHLIRQRTLL